MTRRLRYGMVGGGEGAFIGAVHRHAMALDHRYELTAGALSSTPQKARRSGEALGLSPDRNYPTWEAMLEGELARPAGERIDIVVVVTPNHVHYPVAKAFAEAGFNVVSDKPLVHTTEQANDLVETVRRTGVVFGVTYNYTGYPMVKEARAIVQRGELGALRKVVVGYHQGWLATRLEETGAKQAEWRTDPARSGAAGAIGDIGSHAENLVSTVTGLELEAICADLTTFVPGRRLDDDGNLLLRFKGGAKGVLIASQVEIGHENDLVLQVYGEEGSLTWRQEEPNELWYAPLEGTVELLRRGNPYLGEEAKRATRLPSGHPEAFLEAFANVYAEIADAVLRREAGRDPAGDFPTVEDGARGVRFIERTVTSAGSDTKWTAF
ncbi:MAG TPA: Gfo/Idh/MocA family oxidoreductase [Trueperaceae bacterium]